MIWILLHSSVFGIFQISDRISEYSFFWLLLLLYIKCFIAALRPRQTTVNGTKCCWSFTWNLTWVSLSLSLSLSSFYCLLFLSILFSPIPLYGLCTANVIICFIRHAWKEHVNDWVRNITSTCSRIMCSCKHWESY